ncbi:MAG: lamin tail domain-containing protein [Polyangiales bacterium]
MALGACGDDDGGNDDDNGEERDTGTRDASRNDATTPDAARDAARDADTPDIDAGTDSSVPDASSPPDAGGDATVDAAPPLDAGIDAGSSAVVPNAAGQIVITEIMASPVGYADDSLAEWIEVHNPSTTITYNLGSCVFSDKAGDSDFAIPGQLLVPPGGYRVLASATFTVAANGFVGDVAYGSGTGLSSMGDSPEIRCGGTLIDAVNYGAAGFTAPGTNQGRTLQLSSASLSATANDTGSNWCFSNAAFFQATVDGGVGGGDAGVNYGTPRAENRACP